MIKLNGHVCEAKCENKKCNVCREKNFFTVIHLSRHSSALEKFDGDGSVFSASLKSGADSVMSPPILKLSFSDYPAFELGVNGLFPGSNSGLSTKLAQNICSLALNYLSYRALHYNCHERCDNYGALHMDLLYSGYKIDFLECPSGSMVFVTVLDNGSAMKKEHCSNKNVFVCNLKLDGSSGLLLPVAGPFSCALQ